MNSLKINAFTGINDQRAGSESHLTDSGLTILTF